MERLGIKVLELVITDPMGGQETIMIIPREEYAKAVQDLIAETENFLKSK